MASPAIYTSGLNLAGTVFENGPATLQLDGTVYLSGAVQWLDTIDGDNANAGTTPERPVATLAQAVTNSAANGIIVVGAGSSETIAAAQVVNLDGLAIFGCGTGSSRPRYTMAAAGDSLLAVTGLGVWIEGFYFPASTAVPFARISLGGAGGMVRDCYFECGANDTDATLSISAATCTVKDCSYVVTASRPAMGVEVASAVAGTVIEGCTFDGGSYGWTDYALKVSAAATRIREIGNTFINRSDLGHSVTATTYQIFGNSTAGTSNVLLTA